MLPLSFSEYFCFKQGDKSEAYDDYFLKKIIELNPDGTINNERAAAPTKGEDSIRTQAHRKENRNT